MASTGKLWNVTEQDYNGKITQTECSTCSAIRLTIITIVCSAHLHSASKPEETMNVGSKTPQPDPRPGFLSKAADKTLRLTKSTAGAIPIHLFHGNHCNGSANGADTRRYVTVCLIGSRFVS